MAAVSAATGSQSPPLRRDLEQRVIAGVCSGVEARYGVPAGVCRAAFVIASLFGGVGLAAYVIAIAAIPATGDADARPALGRPVERRLVD
jgi:phage shock protein PspC (stress-responsive transcriptional regulator)